MNCRCKSESNTIKSPIKPLDWPQNLFKPNENQKQTFFGTMKSCTQSGLSDWGCSSRSPSGPEPFSPSVSLANRSLVRVRGAGESFDCEHGPASRCNAKTKFDSRFGRSQMGGQVHDGSACLWDIGHSRGCHTRFTR